MSSKGSSSDSLLGGSILSGLINSPTATLKITDKPVTIPLSKIHAWDGQPRQYFSKTSIEQLRDSFLKYGFKGTLTVRPHPTIEGEYQLIAGERRYRAAKLAKLDNVICFVGDFSDEQALDFALGENLHREDLSKLEETNGILSLIQSRYSIQPEITTEIVNSTGHNSDGSNVTPGEDLANIVCVLEEYGIKLQTFRTSHLATLKLQETLKKAHLEDGLSFLAAKALNQIKRDQILKPLLEEVLDNKLSVREVRVRVKEALANNKVESESDGSISKQLSKTNASPVKTKKPKPVEKIGELKSIVSVIHKARKSLQDDEEKMRKIEKIVKQLKELIEEDS